MVYVIFVMLDPIANIRLHHSQLAMMSSETQTRSFLMVGWIYSHLLRRFQKKTAGDGPQPLRPRVWSPAHHHPPEVAELGGLLNRWAAHRVFFESKWWFYLRMHHILPQNLFFVCFQLYYDYDILLRLNMVPSWEPLPDLSGYIVALYLVL